MSINKIIVKIAIGVLCTLAFSSCSGKSELFPDSIVINVDAPKEESHLTGEAIPVPEEVARGSVGVFAVDDEWLVLWRFGQDCNCTLYNIRSGDFQNFLFNGRSADEMVSPGIGGFRKKGTSAPELCVYDTNQRKALFIDLFATVNKKTTVVAESRVIPSNSMSVTTIGDNLLCNVFFDKEMVSYQEVDGTGEVLKVYRPYAKEDWLKNNTDSFFASTAVRPDGKRIAICMSSMPRAIIVNTVTGEKRVLESTNETDSSIISSLSGGEYESPEFYLWSFATDEHLYASYSKMNEDGSGMKEYIRVYDWFGKFVKNLEIDEMLTSFSVSDDETMIVGITMDGELYKYHL